MGKFTVREIVLFIIILIIGIRLIYVHKEQPAKQKRYLNPDSTLVKPLLKQHDYTTWGFAQGHRKGVHLHIVFSPEGMYINNKRVDTIKGYPVVKGYGAMIAFSPTEIGDTTVTLGNGLFIYKGITNPFESVNHTLQEVK